VALFIFVCNFIFLDPYLFNSHYLIQNLNYPRFHFLGVNTNIETCVEWFVGDFICTLIGASGRSTSSLWFVFTLYLVSLSFHVLKNKRLNNTIIGVIAISSLLLSWLCNIFHIGSYVHVGAFFVAFFFYYLGTVYYRVESKFCTTLRIKIILLLLALILFAISTPKLYGNVELVNCKLG
jgi:hypothetical protein